jgi:DNA-directed RNA polymerase subunit RPC12/RpoP
MTSIQFNCAHCQQFLEARLEDAGATIQCPRCNGSLRVPAMTAATVADVPPPLRAAKTSAGAIWSFVLSLLSVLCFGPLTGIPAIICGHVAYSNINKSQGTLTGGGLAVAGLVIGYIATAVWILLFALGVVGALIDAGI